MKNRKYRFLTNNFFKGSVKIQINSVYRDRNVKPEKVVEFRRAIKNRDCVINSNELTKHQLEKLIELKVYGEVLKIREENKNVNYPPL